MAVRTTPFRVGSRLVEVEKCRIIDVHPSRYTVTFANYGANTRIQTVSFATPYQHSYNGEGIYFMPEVGSEAWVCWPSEGNKPFIMGWCPSRQVDAGGNNYKNNKKDLIPGDIFLGSRGGNFIYLRRGGIIQIGGSPLAQRMYVPINHMIRDICGVYKLHTFAGDLEWGVQREENSSTVETDRASTTSDAKRPATLTLKAREYSGDPNPIATLRVGSHEVSQGAPSNTILSLEIRDTGSAGSTQQVKLEIGKDGSVVWDIEQNIAWTVSGTASLSSEGQLSLSSKGQLSLFGDDVVLNATGTGKDVLIKSDRADVDIQGKNIKVGKKAIASDLPPVGIGWNRVVIATPAFISWLISHTHAPGGPPLPSLAASLPTASGLFAK